MRIHAKRGLWLALLLGCAPTATPTGAPSFPKSNDAPVVWRYEVSAGRAGVDDLAIDAEFALEGAVELRVDDPARPFVHDVEYAVAPANQARWAPATVSGSAWLVPCRPGACKVRYRFALRESATTLEDANTAAASADVVVAPPSTWLLRPESPDPPGRFRFHVSTVSPSRFNAGTLPSPDGAPGTFEASTDALDQSSFALFGGFREEVIRSGTVRVVVDIASSGLALTNSEVVAWVRSAVDAISVYLGRFNAERTLIIVETGGRGPTRGETIGDGGPAVLLRVGDEIDAAKTRDDWVAVHELLHVNLPSLSFQQRWLEEGLATYVEPIVRARAGLVTVQKFWGDLVDGLPQGLPEAGDQGLDRTRTWGRTYWGGALFCFLADLTIRERTHNARSLDDVLRAVVATGANVESHWTIEEFLEVGDRATGTRVLHELYARTALAPGSVDLAGLWSRLGVRRAGGGVEFEETAPLAAIRRAVTQPP